MQQDRYCRNCGQALQSEDQFCGNCGSPVHATAHVPTPEADVPVPPPPKPAEQQAEASPQAPQAAEQTAAPRGRLLRACAGSSGAHPSRMAAGRREGEDAPGDRARLTVPEAAAALGISPEAVRNRLSRGSLKREKVEGTVYVLIDRDMVRPTTDMPTDTSGELVDVLKEQNEYLREQLAAERAAHAEARRIIAGLVERMPQLEAPTGAQQAPEPGEGQQDRGDPRPDRTGAQTAPQRPRSRRRATGPGTLPGASGRRGTRRPTSGRHPAGPTHAAHPRARSSR